MSVGGVTVTSGQLVYSRENVRTQDQTILE